MSIELHGEGSPRALNQLAREQMKLKLLADIRMDMTICEMEGWDPMGHLRDLHDLIAHFDPCENRGAA